jgi:ceramide synthetase
LRLCTLAAQPRLQRLAPTAAAAGGRPDVDDATLRCPCCHALLVLPVVYHLLCTGCLCTALYFSWYANFTRPGVLVMLIHDISDIFLETAKLANYAEQESLSLNLFIVFAVSWVILRVFIYPYVIVHRILVDPVKYIALPYNINPQPHYSAFGTMFLVLWFLHLYWTYLIFKVIEKQLRTGKADDVREEDDD